MCATVPKDLPQVSIVIPTYNRGRYISECIDFLLSLQYPKDLVEIIVVDGGSTDETPKILSGYTERGLIKFIRQKGRGVAEARNEGINVAKGTIVAFIDDDCTADLNWLFYLVEPYKDECVGGVGSESLPDPKQDHNIIAKYINLRSEAVLLKSYAPFSTNNISYRRDILTEIGGFDISLETGEDLDLKIRVLNKEFLVRLAPKAIVWAKVRENLSDFIKTDCIRRGRGYVKFMIKYRKTIFNFVGGRKLLPQISFVAILTLTIALVAFNLIAGFIPFFILLFSTLFYFVYRGIKLAHINGEYSKTIHLMILDIIHSIFVGYGFITKSIKVITLSIKSYALSMDDPHVISKGDSQ